MLRQQNDDFKHSQRCNVSNSIFFLLYETAYYKSSLMFLKENKKMRKKRKAIWNRLYYSRYITI